MEKDGKKGEKEEEEDGGREGGGGRGCIGIEPDGFSSVQVRSNEAIQTVTTDRFKVLRNAAAHGTASTLPAGNISHTDATTRLYLANYARRSTAHAVPRNTLETLAFIDSIPRNHRYKYNPFVISAPFRTITFSG